MARSDKSRDTGKTPVPLPRGYGWRLALARAAVAWERLWPRLWPAAGIAAIFLALAFSDLLPVLPGWLHAAILVAFAAALAAAVIRGLSGFAWPDADAGRRRLERDSGLSHRPLSGLDDTLATGGRDRAAAALWQVHQERLKAMLSRLRVRWPRGSLAAIDPRAVRVVPLLLLVVGLASAGGDAPERLLRAATPNFAGAPPEPASVDVWVDPPGYTGEAPRFLATGEQAEKVLRVPAGSRLLAQVQGGEGEPALQLEGSEATFEPVTANAWKAEAKLDLNTGERLSIRQGDGELAAWQLQIVPDRAPEIHFAKPPQRGQRASLRIEYKAEDDYGLAAVRLEIRRADKKAQESAEDGAAEHEPLVLDLPLPGGNARTAENASYHDLTAHIWAGLPVTMTLAAEDATGQVGRSDPVKTTLPQRVFQHPVARKLVELRKQLTLDPDNRYPVVQGLSRLGRYPSHFYGDVVVALAIRSAERRLIYDKTDEAVPSVQELMWQTALRIEEGELAIAERDLRRAQRELMEALNDPNTSDEELQRLMDELQQAMNRFLEEMAKQMRQRLAEGEQPQEIPPDAQMLNSRDLQEMMRQMRDMMRSGARDAARQMLSRLQEMMENLRMNPMAQQMNEQMRQALEMMRNLRNMTEEQQRLLDESFRRSQRQGQGPQQQSPQGQQPGQQQGQQGMRPGQPGQMGQGQQMQGQAQMQEQLRRQLGELMRQLGDALGDIPRPLGQAEQEMRGASEALRQGRPDQAIPPQSNALEQLREGMQSMQQALQEQMQQQPGQGQGQGQFGMQPGEQRDPLGRARDRQGRGRFDDGQVKIPDEADLQRARQILDELRNRAGDRQRPEFELDYIDRLLERF